MIPIHLTISGFLSYRDPVEINFNAFNLACIAGQNGAGKSSILDAITWALFGQARKRDDSIINMQSEIAEVSFSFDYEGNTYRVIRSIQREKPAKLEFQIATGSDLSLETDRDPLTADHIWKTLSERTIRSTQARIEATLRLDYETFINAAFFLQGKADLFTQQRPGDRKRILSNILGLEIWEDYRQRAVEYRKTLEGEVAALDGRLAEINTELGEEEARVTQLNRLEAELGHISQGRVNQESVLENIKQVTATLIEQRKLVNTLSSQLESTQRRLAELEGRLVSRQQERETHTQILSKESEIKAAHESWLESRDALARWDDIAEQFREHEKRRQPLLTEIETEKARIEKELETLQSQADTLEAQLSEIPQLENAISNLDAAIADLQSKIHQRKSLEEKLGFAQEILANAKAENPRLKSEMDELKLRIDRLSETDGAACPLCGQPLSGEERHNLIEELNTIGKIMGDKYRANRVLLSEAEENVKSLKLKIERISPLDDEFLEKNNQRNKLKTQMEQIETQRTNWEKKGKPRSDELTQILQGETFVPKIRTALKEIDVELKSIGYDAAAHDAVRKSERAGRVAEEGQRALVQAKAALKPLESEISNLEIQIADRISETREQQGEFDRVAAVLAAAEAQAPDIHQAQRDLLDIQEQENKLRLEVGAARQKVLVLDDLKIRRRSLEGERETLAGKIGNYKQVERAFSKDGVPALLIEQALPQIENKANDILERLSGGNMSVRFITQREYKDKGRDDLRETLDIQISDNAGIRDYEMYSGGEAFRVNFAIRLALSEVLAQRAGARLQTLVIDEGFGSQDEIGRQRLIEAINTIKSDFAKILVITHVESMKDAFPARLEVEKTPRGSVVNLV